MRLTLEAKFRNDPLAWKKFLCCISPWDWGQIGIESGTKHVIYQKLANFM